MKKSHPLRLIVFLLLLTAAGIAVFTKGFLFRDKKSEDRPLKIASENITGNFNPFFADSPGDLCVNNQTFMRIQRRGSDNKLTNSAGSISYEYSGEKVKYTVTIKKGLRFSDGSNVTIDDVIFFYYLCADATYDGVFKDFYLNDIQGLKEYYYDDRDYKEALKEIKSSSDEKKYIEKNYGDGISVKEISGIKRVDDYTCTVTYNSRNINSVSALNAFIVSKEFYSANYVKGAADTIKDFTTLSLGCGPYMITDFDKGTNMTSLKKNKYFSEYDTDFSSLEIIDCVKTKTDPVKAVSSGKADVAAVIADNEIMGTVTSKNLKYTVSDNDSYISLFVNTARIPDEIVRRQIMKACTVYDALDERFGSFYTKVYLPLSVRFSEYPGANEPYFEGDPVKSIYEDTVGKLNLYCVGAEDSPEKTAADDMARRLNESGINTAVTLCDYAGLKKAVKAGKADLWVMSVKDGATCDKYDYCHTGGRMNLTGLSDEAIDNLCERLRASTGFTDKKAVVSQLLQAVMEQSVELPVCQLEKVTVYNGDILTDDIVNSLYLNY